MILYDYVFLSSGLLNGLSFLYGFLSMVVKSLQRKDEEKSLICSERMISKESVTTITAKSITNILSSITLLSTSVYIVFTTDVSLAPFFAYDHIIALGTTLLFTVSIFDMVLTLLTERVTFKSMHEIPMHMVTVLVSVAILITKQNAIAGVICLFMYGSVLSDEFVKLKCAYSNTNKNEDTKCPHVFQFFMHILCNFVFPGLLLFTSAYNSERGLLEMEKSPTITFFFALTFFALTNTWRLICVWKKIVKKTRVCDEPTDLNNFITINPMINKGLLKIMSRRSTLVKSDSQSKDICDDTGAIVPNIAQQKTVKGDDFKVNEQYFAGLKCGGQFEPLDIHSVF